jgi:hypothetical protein
MACGGSLFTGVRFTLDGHRLAGAPVGTDAFSEEFTYQVVDSCAKRLEALSGIDPQIGFTLLRSSVIPAISFCTRTTPPELAMPALQALDNLVDTAVQDMLTLGGHTSPEPSTDMATRAKIQLRLPLRHNGLGLTSATTVAPLAYWASVASSQATDPDLRKYKTGLTRFCQSTHSLVLDRLGPPSPENHAAEALFPRDNPTALLDDSFYVELFNDQPALKLQKELSHAAHAVQHRRLLEECSAPARVSRKRMSFAFTPRSPEPLTFYGPSFPSNQLA